MKLIKPSPIANELGRFNHAKLLMECPSLVASMVRQGLMSFPKSNGEFRIPHTAKELPKHEIIDPELPNRRD